MTAFLRIDPGIPIVWSTPDRLRFGSDHAVLEIDQPSPRAQRLIAALRKGLHERHLADLRLLTGISSEEATPLLARLAPVLRRDTPAEPVGETTDRIRVSPAPGPGAQATAQLLARVLSVGNSPVSVTGPEGDPTPDPGAGAGDDRPPLTVLIARYALAPDRSAGLLRRGLPHTPVVFSDTEVRIGPLVTATGDPCLFCLECHRQDAEPAWPAMASQLYDRPSPRETALLTGRAAIEVLSQLERWRDGDERVHWERWVISLPQSGTAPGGGALPAMRRERVRSHRRCGCATLPETLPGVFPRIGAGEDPPLTAAVAGGG